VSFGSETPLANDVVLSQRLGEVGNLQVQAKFGIDSLIHNTMAAFGFGGDAEV
jgi:hypothetical protein